MFLRLVLSIAWLSHHKRESKKEKKSNKEKTIAIIANICYNYNPVSTAMTRPTNTTTQQLCFMTTVYTLHSVFLVAKQTVWSRNVITLATDPVHQSHTYIEILLLLGTTSRNIVTKHLPFVHIYLMHALI